MSSLKNHKMVVATKTFYDKKVSSNPFVSHNYRICKVNKGTASWQIGNKIYEVAPGDVIILNNQSRRIFKGIYDKNGIELIVIEFEPDIIYHTGFTGLFLTNNELDCRVSDNLRMITIFDEIEKENIEKLPNYDVVIEARFIELLCVLVRYFNIKKVAVSEKIYEVLNFINENYTTDISLSEAAKLAYMSTTGFSKYFTKHVGIGFAQYLMRKRINHAIYTLGKSDKTVLEVSMECGFNNLASFYKAFKTITGKHPAFYRNSINLI